VNLQDENYFDDFSDDEYVNESQPVTRCPICGDYIKKIKNKKTATNLNARNGVMLLSP
jgi:hypothetical protein